VEEVPASPCKAVFFQLKKTANNDAVNILSFLLMENRKTI
jgi:hypothetical protein